jgi:antitoxin component of MazEF toxin-antitoxin module
MPMKISFLRKIAKIGDRYAVYIPKALKLQIEPLRGRELEVTIETVEEGDKKNEQV